MAKSDPAKRARIKRFASSEMLIAGRLPMSEAARVAAVLARARETGLTSSKESRISGRVSPELIQRAKARTGLQSDTELVEFALANIAVEDNFLQVFRELKGTVDPDLDLSF